MNRIQFLKRLLATFFGAAATTSLHAEDRTQRHSKRTLRHSKRRTLRHSKGKAQSNPAHFDTSTERSAGDPSQSRHTGRYLLSATVAGTAYYDYPEAGSQLLNPVGSSDSKNEIEPALSMSKCIENPAFGPTWTSPEHPATLRLEPDNQHDFRAIEVYWETPLSKGLKAHKMGYIPRTNNKVLYNLMKDGAQLKAYIRLQYAFSPNVIPTEAEESINQIAHQLDAYELRIRVYLVA